MIPSSKKHYLSIKKKRQVSKKGPNMGLKMTKFKQKLQNCPRTKFDETFNLQIVVVHFITQTNLKACI